MNCFTNQLSTIAVLLPCTVALAGDGVLLKAADTTCTQGQIAEIQVRATTVELIGGFAFNVAPGPLMVSDVRYDGPIFSNGWQGWDDAPVIDPYIQAACIFTEDQVDPGDHNLVTVEVEIPANTPAGTNIPVDLTNVMFFNYTGDTPALDPRNGSIKVFRTSDLSGNGLVGAEDLGLLIASWGPASAKTLADLDGSADVNGADLGRMIDRWGTEG